MSLTAGYDLVIEISKETLHRLVEANLQIQGNPAIAPFELTMPIASPQATGNVHLIVSDMGLDLTGATGLKLILTFENSSIQFTNPAGINPLTKLGGTLTIQTTLAAVAEKTTHRVDLVASLSTATATISFNSASQTEINNFLAVVQLAGIHLDYQQFVDLADTQFQTYVRGLDNQTFPQSFTLVPGVDGQLQPQLQFERLTLHNIGNKAIGLFGILLKANDGNGNPADKQTTSITAGHDVAITLSPGAFHSLIFCPSIANALGTSVSGLPSTCGSGSISISGVKITSLRDSLTTGRINIDGAAHVSKACIDATATIHGSATLTMSGNELTPHLTVDPPHITGVQVHDSFGCVLVGIALGPITLVVIQAVKSILNKLAPYLVKALKGALGGNGGLEPVDFGVLSGASFDTVDVSSGGITLNGDLQVNLPTRPSGDESYAWLSVDGSVATNTKTGVGEGTVHISSGCLAGDYQYTEVQQNQTGDFQVTSHLMGLPLKLEWSLRNYQSVTGALDFSDPYAQPYLLSSASLAPGDGTAVLDQMNCQYPLPPPEEHTITQQVEIEYSLSGNTITLRNRPADGNYSLLLWVTATDPAGNVKDSFAYVQFNGDIANMDANYQKQSNKCLDWKKQQILWNAIHTVPVRTFPPKPPRPTGSLGDLLQSIVGAKNPNAAQELAAVKLAYQSESGQSLLGPGLANSLISVK